MAKQSTRHTYKSRREKNEETSRVTKILLYGGIVLAVLMVLYKWDDIYFYLRTYTME